jgi:hypothetical protein
MVSKVTPRANIQRKEKKNSPSFANIRKETKHSTHVLVETSLHQIISNTMEVGLSTVSSAMGNPLFMAEHRTAKKHKGVL